MVRVITTNATNANLVLLFLQQFHHMQARDLIDYDTLAAFCRWDFSKPIPQEAMILLMTAMNGQRGLLKFVYDDQLHRVRMPTQVQSVLAMRSVTYFVPVYEETIIYSLEDLKAENTIAHLGALYSEDWKFFCDRTFFGGGGDEVLKAALSPEALATLWLKRRYPLIQAVRNQQRSWPNWAPASLNYHLDLGRYKWHGDGPPEIPAHWTAAGPPAGADAADQQRLRQLQFWCLQQVRWWATLRGQTLGKTVYGLMEMREGLGDVAYLELKQAQDKKFLDVDYQRPIPRSTSDEVMGWMERNAY